jgi:hypothetical protein
MTKKNGKIKKIRNAKTINRKNKNARARGNDCDE